MTTAADIHAMTADELRAWALRQIDAAGSGATPPSLPALPSVVSQSERARRAAMALHAKYPAKQFSECGRMGGRPRDPSWDEIQASTGPARARSKGRSLR